MMSNLLVRYSHLDGSLVNCGPVLNWLDLDNRGNRLVQLKDESAINTPAVAAAFAVKPYEAQESDEITLEVGDLISVIDMPPPDESLWWRGKRGFEVGFFPSECVETIGDHVPHSLRLPQRKNVSPFDSFYSNRNSLTATPTKPVLRKHGKIVAFFRFFILSRRHKLRESGIYKERVFGCDLSEHLTNSGQDIPLVLKNCAEFIETCGIVDGIYRLSGVNSNIQKLRSAFDDERTPEFDDEAILMDVHCVASLLKMYFRELPNPLLTHQLYDNFIRAVQPAYPNDATSESAVPEATKVANIKEIIRLLPSPHYRTLEFLTKHLSRVSAHGAKTGMTPKNVAIVWAPNLLRCRDIEAQGGVAALHVIGIQAVLTEYLIRYVDVLFTDDYMSLDSPSSSPPRASGQLRPKSLAFSTPTRLLSLEEARSRCRVSNAESGPKFIEVGGGPDNLPPKYHTIIELSKSRNGSGSGSGKLRKSPSSGWTNFSFMGNLTTPVTADGSHDERQPVRVISAIGH